MPVRGLTILNCLYMNKMQKYIHQHSDQDKMATKDE